MEDTGKFLRMASLPPEDREVLVHRFAVFRGNQAGLGVFQTHQPLGTDSFQSRAGEIMLTVEVRGDDEEAVLIQPGEALLENAVPDFPVIPVVLMPEEGEIKSLAQLAIPVEARAVLVKKFKFCRRDTGRPRSGDGFLDLPVPDVRADKPDIPHVPRVPCPGRQRPCGLHQSLRLAA